VLKFQWLPKNPAMSSKHHAATQNKFKLLFKVIEQTLIVSNHATGSNDYKVGNTKIPAMMSSRCWPSVPKHKIANVRGLAFYYKKNRKSHE
jgi:ribonuclease PH